MPPSARQLAALGACLDAGSGGIKAAAYDFGVSYDRMRRILSSLYRCIGVETLGQAIEWADANVPGWHGSGVMVK